MWAAKGVGQVAEEYDETWKTGDTALRNGKRGLKKGSSLARFLSDFRRKRNRGGLPKLSIKKILAWADVHFKNTGKWPNRNSGAVLDAPQEEWYTIDCALQQGSRGLSGHTSLLRLLA